MSVISIPDLNDRGCEYLHIAGELALASQELADLESRIGSVEDVGSGWTQRVGGLYQGRPVSLNEAYFIHTIEDDASVATEPSPNKTVAHLHFTVSVDASADNALESSDDGEVAAVMQWIRQSLKPSVRVFAGRRFPVATHKPIIDFHSLPTGEAIEPFTTVTSYKLARVSSEQTPAIAYEVEVRQNTDAIVVSTSFKTVLPAESDAVEKILSKAAETMSFAVRESPSTIQAPIND